MLRGSFSEIGIFCHVGIVCQIGIHGQEFGYGSKLHHVRELADITTETFKMIKVAMMRAMMET